MEETIIRYEGMGPNKGIVVMPDEALAFAMERCGIQSANSGAPDSAEFLDMFVEWFYSGGWIAVTEARSDGLGC